MTYTEALISDDCRIEEWTTIHWLNVRTRRIVACGRIRFDTASKLKITARELMRQGYRLSSDGKIRPMS